VPIGLVFGPNGNLFVGSEFTNQVLEYNGMTGAFITDFVPAGTLSSPIGLVFGPNSNLFVGSSFEPGHPPPDPPPAGAVLEYNGATGAFITTFARGEGLLAPQGLVFGPNGNLFVSDISSQVLEYNGTTGAFITDFIPEGSGGLLGGRGLVFGPNGNLFVTSIEVGTGLGQVLEYNGTTGAFITDFVSTGSGGLNGPTSLIFGPQISVPEPAPLFLIGLGLLSTALARRLRRI
jgi:hypothetical protein